MTSISTTPSRTLPALAAWTFIQRRPGTSLAIWLAALLGVRLVLALTYPGFLGVDGGAYILGLYDALGIPTFDTHFIRPPLAPGWLLWPSLSAFGLVKGYAVYAAVFSMSLYPAFYLLARYLLGARWGALATVFLSVDPSLAEMFVTGVVPITGFAFYTLALLGMLALSRHEPRWWPWLAVAIGVPGMAFTNQTAFGIGAVTLPVVWLFCYQKRRVLAALVLGAALSLLALPWYVQVLPGADHVRYPGPLVVLNPWWSSQWQQLAIALAVASLMWRKPLSRTWQAVTALTVLLGVLQVFLSHDEAIINIFYRSSYLLGVPLYLCVAYLLAHRAKGWNPAYRAAGIGAVVLLFYGLTFFQFYNQARYSSFGSADVISAIASVPADATRIATNSESMSFYVTVLTHKPTAWTQNYPPNAAYQDREREVRCLLGWIDGCLPDGSVSHIIVDTRWPMVRQQQITWAKHPESPWCCVTQDAPWLVETFHRGTVSIYGLKGKQEGEQR